MFCVSVWMGLMISKGDDEHVILLIWFDWQGDHPEVSDTLLTWRKGFLREALPLAKKRGRWRGAGSVGWRILISIINPCIYHIQLTRCVTGINEDPRDYGMTDLRKSALITQANHSPGCIYCLISYLEVVYKAPFFCLEETSTKCEFKSFNSINIQGQCGPI